MSFIKIPFSMLSDKNFKLNLSFVYGYFNNNCRASVLKDKSNNQGKYITFNGSDVERHAEILEIDRSTMYKYIGFLEKHNLVKRETIKHNTRLYVINIIEKDSKRKDKNYLEVDMRLLKKGIDFNDAIVYSLYAYTNKLSVRNDYNVDGKICVELTDKEMFELINIAKSTLRICREKLVNAGLLEIEKKGTRNIYFIYDLEGNVEQAKAIYLNKAKQSLEKKETEKELEGALKSKNIETKNLVDLYLRW